MTYARPIATRRLSVRFHPGRIACLLAFVLACFAAPARAQGQRGSDAPAGDGPALDGGLMPFTVPLASGITATDGGPSVGLARTLSLTAGVERAEVACVGRRVSSLTLVGCVGTACEDDATAARVKSLTDILVGATLQPGQLRLAYQRLVALRFFRTVHVSRLPDLTGDARLMLTVTGNAFVRRVDIVGNKALFQDELGSKLLIRPGDVLNPNTPDGLSSLNRQRESIEAVYQRAGYDDAVIHVTAEVLQPSELRVLVAIKEGERRRIAHTEVSIRALPPPREGEEDAGLVCPAISERQVLEASQLDSAGVFTQRKANQARALVRTYLRQLGYANPRVEVERDDATQTVLVDIRPGRCNLLRIFVRQEGEATDGGGFSLSRDTQLLAALPFADSGLFDFDEADRGRAALLAAFENRGYLFADVRLDYRPVPINLASQVENAISYYVTTGYISQIRGISFPGRAHFGASALEGVLTTKAYNFLDTGGYLQIDQLLADLDALRAFYQRAGFYQFHYDLGLPAEVTPTGSPRTRFDTPQATIFEYRFRDKGFQIRKPTGENFVYVDIPLTEGDRSRLRTVRVEGASKVPLREVRSLLGLSEGDVISYDVLARGLRAVEDRYRNTGFFRMELQALCKTSHPDAPEQPCAPEMLLARAVDLRLVLREGERVDVGEVFISGNFSTHREVILRDMPKAGEPFSAESLFESQRALRNLGIFSQVNFVNIGGDEKPPRERIAILVQVVEAPARHIELNTGFQTTDRTSEAQSVPAVVDSLEHLAAATDRISTGFGQSVDITLPNLLLTGEAVYVDQNFLSTAKELRIPLKVGLSAEGFTTDSIRLAQLLPSYFDSRLGGSAFGLRVTAPYFVHDYALGRDDVDKTGVFVEVSRRYEKLATAIGIDTGLLRGRGQSEPEFDGWRDGSQPQSRAVPRTTWDATDSPINPRKGLYAQAEFPYINSRGDQYLKYDAQGKLFIPIGPAVSLAGLLRGGAGFSFATGRSQLPLLERFRLGGQSGLRGYVDDGVRQYLADGTTRLVQSGTDQDWKAGSGTTPAVVDRGDVVANGSWELRFPVAREQGFWGAAFWDYGAIAETWSALHFASVRHGVGLGLRWLIAGQIPLRIDYGVAIGKRCRDLVTESSSGSALPVLDDNGEPTCVKDSFGELSLGLLYSF